LDTSSAEPLPSTKVSLASTPGAATVSRTPVTTDALSFLATATAASTGGATLETPRTPRVSATTNAEA